VLLHLRILLAGACAALTVVGCGAAETEDNNAGETAQAGSSMTVAADADTQPAEEQQEQAQQLAEEAEQIMLDPALAPREKYPKALAMFRDALKIDPNNALAQQSITLIEDIYKGMGRPVPQPA